MILTIIMILMKIKYLKKLILTILHMKTKLLMIFKILKAIKKKILIYFIFIYLIQIPINEIKLLNLIYKLINNHPH